MHRSVTIVIPCYNEAQRLPIDKFNAFVNGGYVRFLFVNDGSTDSTSQALKTLHELAPERFEYYDLPNNRGKAEATRTGILRACESGADYVGYWDADLATPLEMIPIFCELLDSKPSLEMVFGARVRLLGKVIERKALRHYLGRIFATAASLALGISIYDTQCGAKLFRVSPVIRSLFDEPFLTRWLFDVEIIARLIRARRRTTLPPATDVIYEFPLPEWRDVPGSKVKPQDFVKAFVGLVRIYWRYIGLDWAKSASEAEALRSTRRTKIQRKPNDVY